MSFLQNPVQKWQTAKIHIQIIGNSKINLIPFLVQGIE